MLLYLSSLFLYLNWYQEQFLLQRQVQDTDFIAKDWWAWEKQFKKALEHYKKFHSINLERGVP